MKSVEMESVEIQSAESRKSEALLQTKDWIERITPVQRFQMTLQERGVNFVLWAYGFLLITTTTIIFFQGFHAWGFSLDSTLLSWLGKATIGEISGLLILTFRTIFGKIEQ